MPHIPGDSEAGHRNVRPGGGGNVRPSGGNVRPSASENVRPTTGNVRPVPPVDVPRDDISPRIAAGRPTRPLSPEEIQAGARGNFFSTIGNVFDSITAPGAGLLTEIANTRPVPLVEQSLLPAPLIQFLDFIERGTPNTFQPAIQQARSEGLGVVESRARAFEDTRDEFPLAQRLALEVVADPLNIPAAALARKAPAAIRGVSRGVRGARNVRPSPPVTNVSPIAAPPQAVTRDISTIADVIPSPRKITFPIEGTNQAVEFTPPIRTRNARPSALPDKPRVAKAPRTPREFAAQKVDRQIAARARVQKSPLLKRMTKGMKDTKIVRRATTELISEQRPARVARGIAASEGGPIRTRGRRFFGAQRGEFETFEPDDAISKLFTDDEFDELVGMIRDPDIFNPVSQAFQMNTADRAFQKLFDENLLPTEGEIALLEEVFGSGFVRTALSKRTLGRKVWSGFLDVWNLPRAFIASGDLSGTLRQAGMLAAGNPRRFGQANAAQFRAGVSKRGFLIEKELIESNPNFQRFTRKPSSRPGVQSEARLQLTSTSGASPLNAREEVYLSGFSEDIPVIRQSQRAFVTLLNKLRMDVMDDMVGLIEAGGRKATEAELDSIASFINNSTGRGPLPVSQDIAAIFNGIFFSSRLFTSRLALPFSLLSKSGAVRTKAAKDLVKAVGVIIAMEMMVKYSGAGEVETNPRSSDFGKMKFGKVRIDPWMGFQQIARLVGQLATGERKSVGTGSITDLDQMDTIYRFLRSKLHPSAGAVYSLLDGEDFLGEEFLPSFKQPFSGTGVRVPSDLLDVRKNPLVQNVVFLFAQDMLDAIAEEGLLSGFAVGAATFFGESATTFTSPDDVSRDVNGAGFTEIYPFQQTEVRAIFNAQEDETPERLKDGSINPKLPRGRELDLIRMDQLNELADLAGGSRRFTTFGRGGQQNIVRDYFDIKAENAIRKSESRENLFGDTDFQQDSRGTPQEKIALQEYYQAIDESKSPAGRFQNDIWQQKREELTRKWQGEGTLLYVQANTNTKPIPKRLEDFLRLRSKNEWQRIQDSKNARVKLNTRGRNFKPKPDNTSVDVPSKSVGSTGNVRPNTRSRNVNPRTLR